MPALEISSELEGEKEDCKDEEGADEAVEAGSGGGARVGCVDPAAGDAEEGNETGRKGGEEGGRVVEAEEKEPRQLARAATSGLAGGSGSGRRTYLDGDGI